MGKARRALHLRDHRIERAVLMVRRAEIAQPEVRLGSNPRDQRLGETGLAHPWLSRDQHHLAVAGLRLRPAAQQQLDLFLAPNQRRQTRAQRLELTERAVLRDHLPGWHW